MLKGIHLTSIGDNNMLLEPGDGLNPDTPDKYVVELMRLMQNSNTRTLLYDLENVPLIDEIYYTWLVRLHHLCTLTNIELIATNICPTAAFSLAASLQQPPPFKCALDIDSAREGVVVHFKD